MGADRRTREGSGREELIDRIEASGGADGVGGREVGGQWAWRGEGGSGSLGQRPRRRAVVGASERGREHRERGVGMGAANSICFWVRITCTPSCFSSLDPLTQDSDSFRRIHR